MRQPTLAVATPGLAPRIEQGSYAGVLAEVDGIVVAGAGAVMLGWGPSRGEPIGVRKRIVNVVTAPAWRWAACCPPPAER